MMPGLLVIFRSSRITEALVRLGAVAIFFAMSIISSSADFQLLKA
jgi:hypothetical protein